MRHLGHGVGLRVPHYERALRGALDVDWVEVITENFFGEGGRPRAVLEAVRRDKPLVFHGVSLGVGSLDGPDPAYLRRVKALCDAYQPAWVSDHVCWTRHAGRQSHGLLPLPGTMAALRVAVEHTQRAQDLLQRPLLLENVSSYVGFTGAELSEWELLAELAQRSGCALLLDLNNVLVNAHNFGFSPADYLAGLPADRVAQFHLANHSRREHYRFDDHRGPVPDEVWSLYEVALRRFGGVSTLIEWDEELPSWERLAQEAAQARAREQAVLGQHNPARERPAPSVGATALGEPSSTRLQDGAGSFALGELQQLFFAALTWPEGVRDWCQHAGAAARAQLERELAGSTELGVLERLDVYGDDYFYRLLDVLSDGFPGLHALLGGIEFHNLVTSYVLEHPPHAPDLAQLGQHLPAFVQRVHARPLASQLARLELSLGEVLVAADAEPLRVAQLAELDPAAWPALEMGLVPAARLLQVTPGLAQVAEFCRAAPRAPAPLLLPPGLAQLGEGASEAEPARVVVARRGHAVYFRELGAREAEALELLARGTRFEAWCEELVPRGIAAEELVQYLMRWVADELVRRMG